MSEYLALVSRFGLASILIFAALPEVGNLPGFTRVVARYEVLPSRTVPIVARSVPAFELVAGALLALGAAQVAAASLSMVMFAAFSLAVAWNLLRGRRIDCGCLGVSGRQTIGWGTIARNGVLLVAAGILLASPTTTLTLAERDVPALPRGDALAILISCSTAVAAALLISQTRRVNIAIESRPGYLER